MKRVVLFALAGAWLAGAGAVQAQNFDGCGIMVRGIECVLFQSDDGRLWVLDDRGSFNVGDRVHVAGIIDRECITICQQGSGCIRRNSIELCEPPVNCGAIKKTKAKCKGRDGNFKLKGVVKSELDGGVELTLLLDGGQAQVVVTNNNGKAKAKWTGVAQGPHEICIEQCEGRCARTACE